jgi:hypothetical protein
LYASAAIAFLFFIWLRLGLANLLNWLTLVVPVTAMVAGAIRWAYTHTYIDIPSNDDQLRAAVDMLRAELRRQLTAEADIQLTDRREPLAVRWTATKHRIAARRSVSGSVTGTTTQIDGLVNALLALPRRRLVILGDAGTGKTTLALLLSIHLLENPAATVPIPYLLSAASWEPHGETIEQWTERRLLEDFPALGNISVYGPTVVRRLVADEPILPVVDGLDELPESSRKEAILAVNHSRRPVVLTCRTSEYQKAVSGTDVLWAAAVIEPVPPNPRDVIAFLSRNISPLRAHRWKSVLQQVQSVPTGPLALTLSNPLMVSLVQAIYGGADGNPSELLEPGRFASQRAIEDHLLRELVSARLEQAEAQARDPERSHRWNEQKVRLWLVFLAAQLTALGTPNLAWWRLKETVHSDPKGLSWLSWFFRTATRVTLHIASTPERSPLRRRYLRQGIRLRSNTWFGMVFGIVFSLPYALLLGIRFRYGPLSGSIGGLATGIAVVSGFGLIGGLIGVGLSTFGTYHRSGPAATLAGYRRSTLTYLVVFGCVGELVASAAFGVVVGGLGGLVLDSILAIGLFGSFTYPSFVAARSVLAMRGRLPWRLMSFLEDMHQLGILRQLGPVYQFRHARVQEELAAEYAHSVR